MVREDSAYRLIGTGELHLLYELSLALEEEDSRDMRFLAGLLNRSCRVTESREVL